MKLVGNKNIDITDEEYDYYLKLIERFKDENSTGEIYFQSLFDTDKNGFITLIRTDKSIPWAVLFFAQQIMINQRLRISDSLMGPVKKTLGRLDDLEKRMQDIESYNKSTGS